MPDPNRPPPFPGARILSFRETTSTMDEARALAAAGAARGSVALADFQSAGRGRLPGRSWSGRPGASLLFTVVLDPDDAALPGFPLRVGLALLRTIEALVPVARGKLSIKWPNDLLFDPPDAPARKLAGILCEASGGRVLAGIGLNLRSQPWPEGCKLAPISVEEAFLPGKPEVVPSRDAFLSEALLQLSLALREREALARVAERLYGLGTWVRFVPGLPGSPRVEARLVGLGPFGALALRRDDGSTLEFVSGELEFDPFPGGCPGLAGDGPGIDGAPLRG